MGGEQHMSEILFQMFVFVAITFIALIIFGLVYEAYLYYLQWKELTSHMISEAYVSQGLSDWFAGGSEDHVN